jgi:hypothetical protein
MAAAWTAAAAAAVGLGFLAVSLVDASASPTGSFAGAAAAPTSATGSPAASSAAAATGRRATAGGTVIADCSSGQPVLAGVPAAGWWSDDSAEAGKREFTNGSQRVEVRVTCVNGSPDFAIEAPAAVAPSSVGPATTAVVPAPSPTTDDKGGLSAGHGKHGGDG